MKRKLIISAGIIGVTLLALFFVWTGGDSKTKVSGPNKDTETSKPSDQELTAVEALETVVGDNTVTGAKYFSNNTWLVGSTSSNDSGEVFTIVAKYSSGKWSSVDVGTSIDTELLLLEGAPPDVIAYLEEIQ